jgi:hypothetical protein
MHEIKENRRDLLIIVGLFVLLVALVVVADMRAKSYTQVVTAGGGVGLAEGQDSGNNNGDGKGGNSGRAIRYNNTLDFLKMVFLITFIFILFIALTTTIIILVIRMVQQRLAKAPPGAGTGQP